MDAIAASVVGRLVPDQATTGVNVPVCADVLAMTLPENPLGREALPSMMRETPVRVLLAGISHATRVGMANT